MSMEKLNTLKQTPQRNRFMHMVAHARAIEWNVEVPVPWKDDEWWTPDYVVAAYSSTFRLVGPGHEPHVFPWTEAGEKAALTCIKALR